MKKKKKIKILSSSFKFPNVRSFLYPFILFDKYLIKNNFDEYIDNQKFSDFSRRRLKLLNKINFQSRINADVFQIENQFISGVRDFVIRFNTPSYNWLFNSYYEA